VYSLENALILKEAGFKNIQVWIDPPESRQDNLKNIEDYIRFLTKHEIKIISISAGNVQNYPEEIIKLKQADIIVFSAIWNNYRDLKIAEELGIDVITTDCLKPSKPYKLLDLNW
jgi:sugar phosphate isomerase/epimerase